MHYVILGGFLLTVALVPLPRASNNDWAWSPLAVVVAVLLLGWGLAAALGHDSYRRELRRLGKLAVPATLMCAVLIWAVIQMTSLTPAGWASPISASRAFDLPPGTSIVFDREVALTALMRLLTYAGMFLLGACLSSRASDARLILATVAISAAIYTIYAMVGHLMNRMTPVTGLAIWMPNQFAFSGTFVNANNYATYTGVAALTALVLAFPAHRMVDARESKAQRWRRRIALLSGSSGLWLAVAAILLTGVLLSGSRAGWASMMCGIVSMIVLYTSGRRRLWLSLAAVIILLAAVFMLPGGDALLNKSARLVNEGAGGREILFPLAVDMVAHRPFLGWGLGSFESLYSIFQPLPLAMETADKAHNTYLEAAIDLGIPFASLLVLAILIVVARCLFGFHDRGRDRELAGLGFFVSVLAGIHALFDFHLQIPGMACVYAAVLGVAWTQSWSTRGDGN
jgi:O-antigen ligase